MRPQPCVQSKKARKQVTTVTPENTRHSLRNGFNAYTVLSSVIGLSCHRRLRSLLHKLDASVEASGPHDFAVRFGAVRYQRHLRPPHPVPRP
jgi:hypothetical protein